MNYRQIRPEITITNIDTGDITDISKFVLSINIRNSLDNLIQTASLTFAPANEENLSQSINEVIHYIKKVAKKYDIIRIRIDRSQPLYDFYGVIDHIFETKQRSTSGTNRSVSINCSCVLGKILTVDTVPEAPQMSYDAKIKAEFGDKKFEFLGRIRGLEKDSTGKWGNEFLDRGIDAPIKYILKNALSIDLYKDTFAFDEKAKNNFFTLTYIDETKNTDPNRKVFDLKTIKGDKIYNPNLSTYSGNIANYLKGCLETDFYEIFTETVTVITGIEGHPISEPITQLVIRPKPFTCEAVIEENTDKEYIEGQDWGYWEKLPQVEITSSDMIEENLGTNDYDTFNYFVCNNTNSVFGGSSAWTTFGANYPVIDFEMAKKFGIRPYNATSQYIQYDGSSEKLKDPKQTSQPKDDKSDFVKSIKSKRDRIVEWLLYPDFESGQISVRGNAKFKIGTRLLYIDRQFYDYNGTFGAENNNIGSGMEFYITKVEHTYQRGGIYKTNLGVTRGQPVEVDGKNTKTIKKRLVADWLKERIPKLHKPTWIDNSNKPAIQNLVVAKENKDYRPFGDSGTVIEFPVYPKIPSEKGK